MTKEEILFHKYYDIGIVSGEELIIPASYTIDFIKSCYESDLAIIGIEGFEISEEGVKPNLEMIADFSPTEAIDWNIYKYICHQAANYFLQQNIKDNVSFGFIFTVISKEELES